MNETKIEDSYVLTPMQEAMLFQSLFAPHAGMYVRQMIFSMRESINLLALKRAWLLFNVTEVSEQNCDGRVSRFPFRKCCARLKFLSTPRIGAARLRQSSNDVSNNFSHWTGAGDSTLPRLP